MTDFLDLVSNGFPDRKQDMPTHLSECWGYNSTYVLEHVLIPPKLREEVLQSLHAAHHGVIAMTRRSQEMVIWLGTTADIQRTRNMCWRCKQNAPSQTRMPAHEPMIPNIPFGSVCSYLFELKGCHYLVIVYIHIRISRINISVAPNVCYIWCPL